MAEGVGIIGYGSMGRMLARRLIASGAEGTYRLMVATKTPERAAALVGEFPSVRAGLSNAELARSCGVVFLCVPPAQALAVLAEIRDGLKPDTHLISIASCVSLANVMSVAPCMASRLIPSFVSETGEGVLLTCHGEGVSPGARSRYRDLLARAGTIKEIPERDIETYTELTSCAPGIFAAVFEEFVGAAVRHGNIDVKEARAAFVQTMFGLSRLLLDTGCDFGETVARVARKGGMTEIGVSAVREDFPPVFDSIFEKTFERYGSKKKDISGAFSAWADSPPERRTE